MAEALLQDSAGETSGAVILKYIGEGAFVNGVPARDLDSTDIAQSGFTVEQLLAFEPRVYERTDAPLVESTVAVINLDDGASDSEARLASKTLNARRKQKEGEA